MRKVLWSLIIIVTTATVLLLMLAGSSESVIEAEFVRVERADVHQVVPIFGQIVYTDEQIITAAASGIMSRICVKEGERIGENAALFRMEKPYLSEVISAYAADPNAIDELIPSELEEESVASVVRSDHACTVREIYVEEGTPVSAGTPLLRISSHQQRIRCSVAPRDAENIHPGMWAWLTVEGEDLCIAAVESVGERKADILTGMEIQEIVLIPEKEIEMAEYAAVDADVYLAGSDNVLSLPLRAITERDTVWWVNGERCTEIPAQIVLHDEMRAWVHLPEGMTVAIGEFKEGQRIKEVCP